MSDTHTVLTVNVGGGVEYIDLAKELSQNNHRLYRQGRVYHADIVMTNTIAAGQPHTVETIAPTWMARKAWQLAFRKWRESTQHERDNGIKAGRWNDFRILYDSAMSATTTLTGGEYLYTTGVGADGTTRTFQMFGATSAGRFGVLAEYDSLRDTDTDTPAAGSAAMPYSALLAELDDAQANQIQEDGDLPPYHATQLRSTVQTFRLRAPAESNYYRTGMIQIPCGLIKVNIPGGGDIQVKVKTGKYKGVHAEAMS